MKFKEILNRIKSNTASRNDYNIYLEKVNKYKLEDSLKEIFNENSELKLDFDEYIKRRRGIKSNKKRYLDFEDYKIRAFVTGSIVGLGEGILEVYPEENKL